MGANQSKQPKRYFPNTHNINNTHKSSIMNTTLADPMTENIPENIPNVINTPIETLKGADRGRQVLTTFVDSNKTYMAGDSLPQSELSSPLIRTKLVTGQAPDMAIITCADSRVSPEIVFGVGLGKVFVIRNAGNVAWGDSVLGSLEYAVSALNVPLVMVMGHSNCGAIGAAVNAIQQENPSGTSPLERHVDRIAEVIKPSCGKHTDEDYEMQETVRNAVLHNVKDGVKNLKKGDHAVASAYENGTVTIVGAVYDLASGEVCVVDE